MQSPQSTVPTSGVILYIHEPPPNSGWAVIMNLSPSVLVKTSQLTFMSVQASWKYSLKCFPQKQTGNGLLFRIPVQSRLIFSTRRCRFRFLLLERQAAEKKTSVASSSSSWTWVVWMLSLVAVHSWLSLMSFFTLIWILIWSRCQKYNTADVKPK